VGDQLLNERYRLFVSTIEMTVSSAAEGDHDPLS